LLTTKFLLIYCHLLSNVNIIFMKKIITYKNNIDNLYAIPYIKYITEILSAERK